jgi:T-complex protein 1 subunit alpha
MAATGLSISGEREHGQDVRSANVTAVLAVANTLRTSLGPQGLDKMLVDQIGEVTISNDGATILAQLDVEHPAAKVLVELSNLQDQEVGDGTTSVVLLAAELLSRGNDLVKNHVHPTAIMNGYRLALRESVNYIQKNLMLKLDQLPKETLFNLASTSLSSKFVGANEMFAKMVVQAIESVKVPGPAGKAKYPVAQVNIIKSHGRSITESTLIPNGYAIPLGRAGQGRYASTEREDRLARLRPEEVPLGHECRNQGRGSQGDRAHPAEGDGYHPRSHQLLAQGGGQCLPYDQRHGRPVH